jgi:hypothetical protein
MRRVRTGWAMCGVCLVWMTLSVREASGQDTAAAPAKPKESVLTLEGNTALWAIAVRADQSQAFEQVMVRLRQALTNSQNPQRREQAKGWKVVRLGTPLPDGAITYVHVIHPVVRGANYSVMQILYDEFPDERRVLYDLYRGAFDRNVSLATGTVALDLSVPSAGVPSAPTAVPTP